MLHQISKENFGSASSFANLVDPAGSARRLFLGGGLQMCMLHRGKPNDPHEWGVDPKVFRSPNSLFLMKKFLFFKEEEARTRSWSRPEAPKAHAPAGPGAFMTMCVVDVLQALTSLSLMGVTLDSIVNAPWNGSTPTIGSIWH